MEVVIKLLADSLSAHFDGKTVGTGGDYGATLSRGPYDIRCYFHQWQDVIHPSIHLQMVQERSLAAPLECCGGGVHALALDFRISVDSKVHGYSIAAVLHEALREWLCKINGADVLTPDPPATPTPDDITAVVYTTIPTSNFVYEGEIFSIHVMTELYYVRQEEGVLI